MFSQTSCIAFTVILCFSNFSNGIPHRSTPNININYAQKVLWNELLRQASNGTGELNRDVVLETLVEKIFTNVVQPKLSNGEEFLGERLDPFWLFPIGECSNKSG